MSDRDLELPDDDRRFPPEAVLTDAALAVAVLALELIADDGDSRHTMARAALGHLWRRHPVSRDHFSPSLALQFADPEGE